MPLRLSHKSTRIARGSSGLGDLRAVHSRYVIAEDPGPYYYVPLTQNYSPVRVLHIHSALPAGNIARKVQAQVHALDPWAYVCASLVLVAVAALGCYIPARRAVRVDPMVTLHYE